MRALLLGLFLTFTAVSAFAADCDTPESTVVEALKDNSDWPERTYKVLEGDQLQTFLKNATAKGYLTGTLYLVNKVYIIDAKVEPHAIPKVWIFFIQDGCVIAKLVADKPQVEECL